MSAAAKGGPEKRCFYLLDDEQAAALEQYQMALRGVAELACSDVDGENGEVRIGRLNLQALFAMFQMHLSDILRRGELETIWADRMTIKQAARP